MTLGHGYIHQTMFAVYYLDFHLPSGFLFSPKDVGADNIDSDADPITGSTIETTLSAGENDFTWDAGMYMGAQASIGDYVWLDLDHDGIQDAEEEGHPNVIVELYTGTGTFVANTTTNAEGYYLFDNLAPSDYYLKFTAPSGYEFTLKDAGADNIDSDADPTTGQTAPTTLSSGEHIFKWDAGLYSGSLASIGNYVWFDTDQDGIQDGGESGLENVTVNLYKRSYGAVQTYNQPISSSTDDAEEVGLDGSYGTGPGYMYFNSSVNL